MGDPNQGSEHQQVDANLCNRFIHRSIDWLVAQHVLLYRIHRTFFLVMLILLLILLNSAITVPTP